MHTLSAFYNSALASAASDVVIPAVQDQCLATQNSRIFPPTSRQLLAAAGLGADLTIMRLDSATLLLNGRPLIYPLDSGVAGGSLPGYMWYGQNGITLPGLEQIAVLGSRAVVAAAPAFAGLWHTDRYTSAPGGPVKTIRTTAAVVFAAGTWTLGNLVFDTPLSIGKYAVVGMAAQGTNALMARLVFPQMINRPGCLAVDAVAQYLLPTWRNGNSGLYGIFDSFQPPQVEFLGVGAGGTQEVYLDIVKVGGIA